MENQVRFLLFISSKKKKSEVQSNYNGIFGGIFIMTYHHHNQF